MCNNFFLHKWVKLFLFGCYRPIYLLTVNKRRYKNNHVDISSLLTLSMCYAFRFAKEVFILTDCFSVEYRFNSPLPSKENDSQFKCMRMNIIMAN